MAKITCANCQMCGSAKSKTGVTTVGLAATGKAGRVKCPNCKHPAAKHVPVVMAAGMPMAPAGPPGAPVMAGPPPAPVRRAAPAAPPPVAPLPFPPSLAAPPPPPALDGPPVPVPCAACGAPAELASGDRCTFCGWLLAPGAAIGPPSPPPGWWVASDGRWYPPQV